MRPLAGHVIGVKAGIVIVKLETGNKREIRTKKKFKKYDKVRVSFNFKTGKVTYICLASDPPRGTEKCSRCSQTFVDIPDDDGFEGDIE